MAWTSPTTRTTGELITATIWNTDLTNNLTYLKSAIDTEVTNRTNADTILTTNTAGVSGLRVIAGIIAADGSITAGTGFTVDHPATGRYVITPSVAFATNAKAVGNLWNTLDNSPACTQYTTGNSSFEMRCINGGVAVDLAFSFIAVG